MAWLIGLVSFLLAALLGLAAAEEPTTRSPGAFDPSSSISSITSSIANSINNPLNGITLPDNALSIGFQSIGVFLLLAGLVAIVAYVALGLDKSGVEDYSYTAPTGYAASSYGYGPSASRYAAPASGYVQEDSYNIHRNIETAASKYQ
nr:uncharacterized protein LOC123745915 [Procambarus clarkii]